MNAKVYSTFFSFCATALLLFFVFREQSWAEFEKIIAGIDFKFVIVFAIISVLGAFFRMLRYRVLLRVIAPENDPGYGKLLITTFARNAFVDMFPLRLGETVYIFMLNRFGISLHAGISSFGVCIILDVLVLLFIFGVLLLFNGTIPTIDKVGISTPDWLIVFLLVFIFALWMLCYYSDVLGKYLITFFERSPVAKLKYSTKIIQAFRYIIGDLEFIKKSKKITILLFYTLVLRIFKYGSLYVLLFAIIYPLGYRIEGQFVLPIFVAFIAAEASASLPASGIMGMGAYQGVWATIITLLGIKIDNPLSISFIIQIISQIFAYSLGIISVLIFLVLMLRKPKLRAIT